MLVKTTEGESLEALDLYDESLNGVASFNKNKHLLMILTAHIS